MPNLLFVVAKYLEYALEHSKYHRLEDRIDALIICFRSNNCHLSVSMKKALFNLDKQFLDKKGIHDTDWSPEFKRAGCMVSYWKYRLRDPSFNSDAISRKLGKEAGLALWEIDQCFFPPECKLRLAEATAWFTCLKRDAVQYRIHF